MVYSLYRHIDQFGADGRMSGPSEVTQRKKTPWVPPSRSEKMRLSWVGREMKRFEMSWVQSMKVNDFGLWRESEIDECKPSSDGAVEHLSIISHACDWNLFFPCTVYGFFFIVVCAISNQQSADGFRIRNVLRILSIHNKRCGRSRGRRYSRPVRRPRPWSQSGRDLTARPPALVVPRSQGYNSRER